MSTGEPCEGGCGCRLGTDDPLGHSDAGYPFEIAEARIPTYVAAHTPRRCRTIRKLREAVASAVPAAEVTVRLLDGRGLLVLADVVTGWDAHTAGQILPNQIIAYGRDVLDWNIGAIARQIAETLACPIEQLGAVPNGPVIARDPYARRAT